MTRNFPPQIGGLERESFYLYKYLKRETDLILIKWGGGKKYLPFILPYFLIRASLLLLLRRDIDVIHLNEGFLSILGLVLRAFAKPISVTVHGLDITYKNKIYQRIIPKCLSRLDKIICISGAVVSECIKRGIPPEKLCLVSEGLEDEFYMDEDKQVLRRRFKKEFGIEIGDKMILLSVGRLVPRKGIHWFVENVISTLLSKCENFIYLIVGEGPMRRQIQEVVREKGMDKWVFLLGKLSDDQLRLVYNIADIFIMPNIPLEGDLEGFGIVCLEAASCKLPIIASNLEGIKDATLNGKIGILVPPLNVDAFVKEILSLMEDGALRKELGERARSLVLSEFNWGKVAKGYLQALRELSG